MRKPRNPKDDGALPGAFSRVDLSRREWAVPAFEDEGLDASRIAARQKRRRLEHEEWVEHASERKNRKSQEAKFKEALTPLMAKRSFFSAAEIADEIARPFVDAAGHREPSATTKSRWALVKRLTNDMLAGYFDERGKIIVALDGVFELTGSDFCKAWYAAGAEALYAAGPSAAEEPYCDPQVEDEPYLRFLRACYIMRKDCAVWVREQEYTWPKSWGFEPISAVKPKTTRRGRGAPKRDFTRRALEDLHGEPKSWPGASGDLLNQVNEWLKTKGYGPISMDTLQRVIGRTA